MWRVNFRIYTYHAINGSYIDFSTCDKLVQSIFKALILNGEKSKEITQKFAKIKNAALKTIKTITGESTNSVLERAFNLGIAKNADYGETNILKFGLIGISVRIGDKLARVQNLMALKIEGKVTDEKIEDTLLDIINYSTYGQMLNDGVWK